VHTLAQEVAELPEFRGKIPPEPVRVMPPEFYYNALAPLMSETDIWQTTYLQQMKGQNAVYEWARGTLLLPFFAALQPREQESFGALYAERLRAAYPQQPDGSILFPFQRLFIIGRR
jgi:trans-aconitate 2-methyltransferase